MGAGKPEGTIYKSHPDTQSQLLENPCTLTAHLGTNPTVRDSEHICAKQKLQITPF